MTRTDPDHEPAPATNNRRLLARVQNPVQVHEIWLEDQPGDPLLNMGKPTYPFIVATEYGGEYKGERTIDLGTLVHLMLNVGEEELWAIARRLKDAQGQDTSGGEPDGCPHSAVARRFCNTCHASSICIPRP